MNREEFRFYCKCGAAWTGKVDARHAKAIREIWDKEHFGPGHAPATSRQAAEARRRAERTVIE